MPLGFPLSSFLNRTKALLHSTDPWIWLYSVQVSPSTCFRFAAYQTDITIYEGLISPYTAYTYEAFPLAKPSLDHSQRGDLSGVTLTVSNISQEISSYVETTDLTGNEVRILVVNSGALGSTVAATALALDERFQIQSISANWETVEFQLGHWNLFRKDVPSQRFTRTRCRFEFGGAECSWPLGAISLTGLVNGFDLSLVSGTVCDLNLDGQNGCRAHGAAAKQMAIPVQWPRRYGGFPGIVKGKGV